MKKFAFFFALALCVMKVAAQDEMYAVLDGSTLTFYYDDRRDDRGGLLDWHTKDIKDNATEAEFDKSFTNARPVSMSQWFLGMSALTAIDFENLNTEEVTDMSEMFRECKSMKILDLSSFNTAKVKSMKGMFCACKSLTTLKRGSGFVTSAVTDMSAMFCSCTSLDAIDLSGFDTKNVIRMSEMFRECAALTTLDLSAFNTRNVTSMAKMFYQCGSLASLDISMFDLRNCTSLREIFAKCAKLADIKFPEKPRTEKVTDMAFMFNDCKALKALDLSAFNISRVADMRDMFSHCEALATLVLPSADAPALTDVYDMFSYCKELTALEFNIGTSAVEDMRYMFSYCQKLASITFGDKFSTVSATLMSGMFLNCNLLASIDLDKFDTQNVTDMGQMFFGCKGLTTLTFGSNFRTDNVTNMAQMFDYCSYLTSLDLSGFNTSKVTSMSNMFTDCQSLKSLTLGSGFNTSEVQHMYAMFQGCVNLESLDLSGFDTHNVLYMDYMFDRCIRLTSLDLSSFDTHKVIYMARMFNDCEKLSEIKLSGNFSTENVTTMEKMFADCKSLASIDLKGFDIRNVKEFTEMFRDCELLTSLDLSGFDTREATVMSSMFENCKSLTSLDLSSFDTHNVFTFDKLFKGCEKLTGITFGSKFSTSEAFDMSGMFYDCQSLTALDLSAFDTRKVMSMAQMFGRCALLTSLDLSSFDTRNVLDMNTMFARCKSLSWLDLSSFNTSSVQDMRGMFNWCEALTELNITNFDISGAATIEGMFAECKNLKTIYCNDSWIYTSAETSDIFIGCKAIVGENGTTFSGNVIDYARPDEGGSKPGYFTKKKKELYTVFDATSNTLTFYYDTYRDERGKKSSDYTTDLLPADKRVNYGSYQSKIEKAVIHHSLANTWLSSTAEWFIGAENLKEVTGLENLKTDGMSNMSLMFSGCTSLESIDLSMVNTADVTNMRGMFWNCSSLREVNLQGLQTGKVTDMRYMFSGCKALEDLDVTMFSTNALKDADNMFDGCESLTSLDLSTFNISDGVSLYMMFSDCKNLVTLWCNSDCSGTSSSTYYMFYGCEKLEGSEHTGWQAMYLNGDYARPDGGTSSPGYFTAKKVFYTEFDGAQTVTFRYDTDMASRPGIVNLAGTWNSLGWSDRMNITKAVVDASLKDALPESTAHWFAGLQNLSEITGIENINTQEVTDMSGMFDGCMNLTELDFSSWNTAKVENMSGLLSGCTWLSGLTLGKDFVTGNVKDMSYMFYGCKSLTQLKLTLDTRNVTNMHGMFAECQNLNLLDFGDNFITGNVTDMGSMFEGCVSLTAINVGGFDTRNVTDMSGMFRGCLALTDIDLYGFNVDKVLTMEGMFASCSSLQMLDLRNFAPLAVMNTADMFRDCSSLVTIKSNLPWYGEGFMVFHSENMFLGCTSLEGLEKYNDAVVDMIGTTVYFTEEAELYTVFSKEYEGLYYFFDVNRLQEQYSAILEGTGYIVDLVDNKEHFDDYRLQVKHVEFDDTMDDLVLESASGVLGKTVDGTHLALENLEEVWGLYNLITTDMSDLFRGCKSLKSIDVEDLNTEIVTNMSGMFDGCESLDELDLSYIRDTRTVTDMSRMFRGCKSLTSLDLRFLDMTNVESTSEMFAGCSALTTLTGETAWAENPMLTSTADMFAGCGSLKGSNGTAFAAEHTDGAYARPDNNDAAGYFSMAAPEKYVFVNADDSTFTFCYDSKRISLLRGDKYPYQTYPEEDIYVIDDWMKATANHDHALMRTVEFRPEFAAMRPTTVMNWFNNAENLKEIIGLQYLNTEEVTDMSGMFSGCKSLAALDLSNFNTAKVENMNGMFYDCNSLVSLDLSTFDTRKTTNMMSMFRYCYELKELTFGENFLTDEVLSMSNMFQGCKSLETLDLSRFNPEGVMDMDRMFRGCTALKTIDLSNFDMKHTAGAMEMFYACSSLTTILCSNDWNAEEGLINSENMFYGCTALVGGNGTKHDPAVVDKAYARPDGGSEKHGYFTASYAVVFNDYDGKLIDEQTVVAGGFATAPADPSRENYNFLGWDNGNAEVLSAEAINSTPVQSDITYTAKYEIVKHTVTFLDHNGDTYKTLSVEHGGSLEAPEGPAWEGHTFKGWDQSLENITAPMTVKPIYDDVICTVLFLDYDGTEISKQPIVYGKSATAPADQTREGYIFLGWKAGENILSASDINAAVVTADITYTAQYKLNTYALTLSAIHGTVSLQESGIDAAAVEYGTTVHLVVTPDEGYEFLQWDDGNKDNPRSLTVTKDEKLVAICEKAEDPVKYFTVLFLDWDDKELSKQVIEEGKTATAPADPKREADEQYTYEFLGWKAGESLLSAAEVNAAAVTADITYKAQYKATEIVIPVEKFTITVLSPDESKGTVSGGGEYEMGATAVLTATAKEGFKFTNWNDGNTDNPRSVVVTEDKTFIANFEKEEDPVKEYTITVLSNNEEWGTVTGSGTYKEGSTIQIVAVPAEGYKFTQWNDGNTDNPRSVVVAEDKTFIATFEKDEDPVKEFTITVLSNNEEWGTVIGSGTYKEGATIQIVAVPAEGYKFTNWNDGNTDNPRSVVVTEDKTFIANFEKAEIAVEEFTISVLSSDETKGTVEGGGVFKKGETIFIGAIAKDGWKFKNWNDGNTDNPRAVVVEKDETFIANFEEFIPSKPTYTVTLIANPAEGGTVYGGGEYEEGETAVIGALPAEGWEFKGWSDGVNDQVRQIVISENLTLVANFQLIGEGVEEIESGAKNQEQGPRKVLIEGHVYIILPDGTRYDMNGRKQ